MSKLCYLANFPLPVTRRTESSVENLIATERKGSIDSLSKSTVPTFPPLEMVDQTLPSILRMKRSETVLNSWMDFCLFVCLVDFFLLILSPLQNTTSK